MKKAKLLTNYKEKIVLATSSNTRIKMLKEFVLLLNFYLPKI